MRIRCAVSCGVVGGKRQTGGAGTALSLRHSPYFLSSGWPSFFLPFLCFLPCFFLCFFVTLAPCASPPAAGAPAAPPSWARLTEAIPKDSSTANTTVISLFMRNHLLSDSRRL